MPTETLRQRTRRIHAATPELSNAEIAKAILAELGPDPALLAAALSEILPSAVNQVLSEDRRAVENAAKPPFPIVSTAALLPVSTAPKTKGKGGKRSGKNLTSHYAATDPTVQAWWNSYSTTRIDGVGGGKLMADAVLADFVFAAEQKRKLEASAGAKAIAYEKLVSFFHESGYTDPTTPISVLPIEGVMAAFA